MNRASNFSVERCFKSQGIDQVFFIFNNKCKKVEFLSLVVLDIARFENSVIKELENYKDGQNVEYISCLPSTHNSISIILAQISFL